MRIVWHGLYEEAGDPPAVEWVYADTLVAGSRVWGLCFAGWKVQVKWWEAYGTAAPGGADGNLSRGFLTHELMHYRTWLRTGDVDPAHWRGDWYMADEVAFYALRDAGL